MFEKASWIKSNSSTKTEFYDQTPAPYIAKGFELNDEPASAVLNVCGLGEAAYFINGKTIPGSYRPTVWTNALKTVIYNVFDVTELLKKGKNRFTAMLGNMRMSRLESSIMVVPQLIMQLDIELKNGEKISIVSDKSFKTADSPIVFSSACCGEIYDATRETEDCTEAWFDDSGWDAPIISVGPGGAFKTTKMPPIRKIREIPPKKIIGNVFDFGEVSAGYVRAKISAPKKSVIKLKYSERLLKDGHVNMNSFSQWKYPDMMNCDMYVSDGKPDRVFEQYFSVHGFRYVEVEGEYASIELTAVEAHTDLKGLSEFSCDNDIINKIHSACRQSILTCTQGTMVDNPRRDLPWLGDIMLSCEANVINFDTDGLFEKILCDCIDEQRPTGVLPWSAPSMFPAWEQNGLIGPDWGDSVMFHMAYYTYLYTGRDTLIRQAWDSMERSLRYFENLSCDYLIPADIGTGDWSAMVSGCDKEITNTAYFYWDSVMMSEFAEILGKNSKRYRELADNIREAFRNKYVCGGKMRAKHISERIIPAFAGLLTPCEEEEAVRKTAEEIEAADFAFTFGVLGMRMVFDLLSKHKMGELIYKVITNTEAFGYAKNAADGFKTLPELFDPEQSLLLSHNHHFFAMVDSWFYKYIAGIRYEKNRHLVIEPLFLEEIKEFSANMRAVEVNYKNNVFTVCSPVGFCLRIKGKEYEKKAGKYEFKID